MVDYTKLKEEIAFEQPSFDYTEVAPDLEKIKDVLLLLKKIRAEPKEMFGISKPGLRTMFVDLTDFDALTDFEREIKATGRVVHGWTTIYVPHLVMITSPAVK
jgi:hypothetical protein